MRDALSLQVLMHDHGLDAVAQAGLCPDLGRLRAGPGGGAFPFDDVSLMAA